MKFASFHTLPALALFWLACCAALAGEPRIPPPTGTHRLITNDDGHNGFYSGELSSAESLRQRPQRLAGTHLWIYQWCVTTGTRTNYPSKVDQLLGEGVEEEVAQQMRAGDRTAARLLRELRDSGVDTLAEVARGCHQAGLLCYPSFRMNPVYNPVYAGWPDEVIAKFYNSRFWWDHPELRQRNRSGGENCRFSYVFPAVRDRMTALVHEVLERDVDGVDFDFLRAPPFVGYEAEATGAFTAKYGLDPLALPEGDERWLRFRAGYMTEFMRRARAEVDAAGRRKGKALGLSVRIDQKKRLLHGCDVETWVKEGLVDILVIAQYGKGGYELELRPFVEMVRGTPTLVLAGEEAAVAGRDPTPGDYAKLKPGERLAPTHTSMTLETYRERARRWYAQGAQGLHLFNEGRVAVFNTLGDRESLLKTESR